MNETIGLADAKARLEVRPVRRVSPQGAVKKIRTIAKRVSKRNAGKATWPEVGRSLRDFAHEQHRF